ncbi:MAG TPA: ABC transporter permease [Vicinamibacterales bacterium]|nr:ABC transporter permease [Vicinamibacterales bacterium]
MSGLRHAVRSLWNAKAFSAVAVATIALGVGANTAVFSVVDAVLLQPLPFLEADRIVTLTHVNLRRDMRDATISYPSFADLLARERRFASLSAYTFDSYNLTGGDAPPEQLPGLRVTASFFDVLGVTMAAGPGFTSRDDVPGGPPVVVLGRRFWSRRFVMKREAIGTTLTLNGAPHLVVGALGVDLPPPFANIDVWTTRVEQVNGFTPAQVAAGLGYLWGIARLPPGVRVEDVQQEVDAIVRGYARANPGNTDADPEASVRMVPIRERGVASARPPLLMLAAAVGLVLLIACANVASLLLVRATGRAHETAVRAALGASRGQLLAWLGRETAVLAASGGVLGTILSLWLVDLAATSLRDLPRGSDVHVNATVLAFSLLVTAVAGLLFGLAPALRAARQQPVDALRAGGRTASVEAGHLGAVLVVVEVALSLTLLVAAGLLLKSLVRLMSAPVGFQSEGLVAMNVSLPTATYGEPAAMRSFITRVLPAIDLVPGVAAAAASMSVPPTVNVVAPYLVADGPDLPLAQRPFAAWSGISPWYFRTMRIPLLAGRTFTAADDERAPLVVVISESLARRGWPNASPIGRRLLVGRFPGFAEVVGVVGDVKNAGLAQPPQPQAYTPYSQRPWPTMTLVVRAAAGDPLALVNAVRTAVWSVDRELPVTGVEGVASSLSDSIATTRLTAVLLALFALAALVIAAIGLYGVIAQAVVRRSREVGIRIALGADARSVAALVASDALRLVAGGMGLGVVAAALVVRAVRGLVFDVSPSDPATYAAVIVVFTLTAIAAATLPVRRALRVDPLIALRAE